MKKTLLIVAAFASIAPAPVLFTSPAFAQGNPDSGIGPCEDYGPVLVCFGETRASCQRGMADQIRANGAARIVRKYCEQIYDGRWIFLMWP